jgi:fused signal recognition particle receptor
MAFFKRFKKKKALQEQEGQPEAQEQAVSPEEQTPEAPSAPQGEAEAIAAEAIAEQPEETSAAREQPPREPEPAPEEEAVPTPVEPVAELEPEEPAEPDAPAEPKAETEALEAPEGEPRRGLWGRLGQRLKKTKDKIGGSIDRITLGKKIDEDTLDELEEVLVTADLGVQTSLKLIEQLRGKVARKELDDAEALKKALAKGITEVLAEVPPAPERDNNPHVIMVVGVNGVGKTTSIGKLANYFKRQGRSVLLAAGDTFRAAANEQLTIWCKRVGCDIVGGQEGADPSAVAYDAVEAAITRGHDLVLIDTAGRLHTKVNLMDELKKIQRVLGKKLPGAPHEVILVVDATTGQNALQQAKLFNQVVPLTGLILTKLDGTAKGGVVVAISGEMKLPICFVGLGEGMEDLRPFEAEGFAEAIF